MKLSLLCLILALFTVHVSCNQIKCLSNQLNKNGSDVRYSSLEQFTESMCAQCYSFIIVSGLKPLVLPINGEKRSIKPLRLFFTPDGGAELCKYYPGKKWDCVRPHPDKFNRTHPEMDETLSTFSSDFLMKIFIQCCEEAQRCCIDELNSTDDPSDDDMCPTKWDAWDCWPRTPAGEVATRTCPVSALQSHGRRLPECMKGEAIKICDKNGKWHRVPSGTAYKEETNYVHCSFVGRDRSLREVYLRLILDLISIIFVASSCAVFIGYKMYRGVRVRVHLNFFVSLLLTCVSDILFYMLIRRVHFQPLGNVLIENSTWCRFLTVFVKFAKLTNYCWMLCEGIYLHKLIVHAFHEQTRTLHFYLVGWALPVIAMIPYVIVHKLKANDSKCWVESMGNLEWIHYPLPMICLLVNCGLLGNIIRVLCTKLRSSPEHFRAALRATAFLIPVFGVHYVFYVSKGPRLQETCDAFLNFLFYLSIAVDCLQGAIVATTFCLLNSEVHSSIRKTIRRRFKVPEIVTEEQAMSRTSLGTTSRLSLPAIHGRIVHQSFDMSSLAHDNGLVHLQTTASESSNNESQ